MPVLPNDRDPYQQQTPYEFLGVKPTDSAVTIRNRHTRLKRDVQESGLSAQERAKKLEALDKAYDQIRAPVSRVQVDFFFIDETVGKQQCQKVAESIGPPNTEAADLIKPKRITVNHLALVDVVEQFNEQPQKIVGFHPQPTGLSKQVSIPDPVWPDFDC